MLKSLKKTCLTVITTMLLMTIVVQMPSAFSINSTNQETLLTFLTDVVGLDMSKYAIKSVNIIPTPSTMNVSWDQTVRCILESEESSLEVLCNFRDAAIVWCSIDIINGSFLLAQPSQDDLTAAKNFLNRYQTFSKATYVYAMQDLIDTITELKSETVTKNDMRLEIFKTTTDYTRIEWMDIAKGINNTYNRASISFSNGILKQFSDNMNRYSIGNTDINIPEAEATSIAKEQVKSFFYTIGGVTVNNLTVADKPEFTSAELTMQPRSNALYPHWEILLPLDNIYPGDTTGIRVLIWADTGEIALIQRRGSLGSPLTEESIDSQSPSTEHSTSTSLQPVSTEPSLSPQPNNKPISSIVVYIIAGAIVMAITIAAMVVFKKRGK